MTDPIQLKDLVKTLDITVKAELVGSRPGAGEWTPGSSHWHVLLLRGVNGEKKSLCTYFTMGPALKGPPSVADVLSSLVLDASCGEMSLEEYLEEFATGYLKAKDVTRALRAHETCQALAPRLREFLGGDFEAVQTAEH